MSDDVKRMPVAEFRRLGYLQGIDDGFGHWLAGFTDGEGCFLIVGTRTPAGKEKYHCAFRIAVRADDEAVVREIQERTGIGIVYVQPKPGGEEQASWNVHRKAECAVLTALFTAYPLRAKKARDFETWATAVAAWQRINPRSPNWAELRQLKARLVGGRRFEPVAVEDYDDPQLSLIEGGAE